MIRNPELDHKQGLSRRRGVQPLLAVSLAASVLFLVARPITAAEWPVIFKVLSIGVLAILGFRADLLLGTALVFSVFGDFLLGIHRWGSLDGQDLFLCGLGSFLLAHLVYIIMFLRYRVPRMLGLRAPRWLGVATVLAVLGIMLAALWPYLGALRIPVVVYAIALSCMGFSAMMASLGSVCAGIGALLFISSDAMLAISKFRGPFPGSEQLIWITYYLAQWLIWRAVYERWQANTQVQRGLG